MNLRNLLAVIPVALVLFLLSCGKDPVTTPGPVNPADSTDTTIVSKPKYNRDSAVNDYNAMYLGTELSSVGWTGNAATCDPGSVPQAVHDAVIKRINYYRKITGLNWDCTLDASLILHQQRTALMMSAAGDLSHNPDASWPCYTPEGADGAKKSNLRLGSAATEAVVAFMDDSEDYNKAVGHRRWLLYSKQSAFSHGSTHDVGVIHVLVKAENTKIPDFIAWPPANFVPRQVVYKRWSFSIPSADFATASVIVTYDGKQVPVTIVSSTDKVADNTIVWELDEPVPDVLDKDRIYTVTVNGISAAKATTYTYDVKIIKI